MTKKYLEKLNEDQILAATSLRGAYCTLSGAGTGKTKTLVARFHALRDAGVPLDQILCLTFTDAAAEEMASRAGLGKSQRVFRTFHSFGYEILQNEMGVHAMPDPRAWSKLSFRLSRKHGIERAKDLLGYISRQKRNGVGAYEAVEASETDLEYAYALAYKEYVKTQQAEEWIDFDDMLCIPKRLLEESEAARQKYAKQAIQVDEAQDTDTCHPAGTLIKQVKENGSIVETPIEDLRDGDRVVAWKRRHAMLVKRTDSVTVGRRRYAGDMLRVAVGDKCVDVTPDHKFYVTMNGKNEDTLYLVYLMYRKDKGFRVGQCAMRYSHNTNKKRKSMPGLGTRFNEERADAGWILRVEKTKEQSQVWEQIISCRYGIPYATYGDKTYNGPFRKRNAEMSRLIFENTDGRGQACLKDHKLFFSLPLFVREESGTGKKSVSKRYFETAAANLLPEIMSVPSTEACSKCEITGVSRYLYDGDVYSLNVPEHHTYVANGIVVKNCQWKIVKQIAQNDNVFVVGDPNQSLYSWRGAKPEYLLKFTDWYPSGKYLYLGKNYRATVTLVDYCRKKAPIQNELIERLHSASGIVGPKIEYKCYGSPDSEAEAAVEMAQRDPLNTAILGRTNRLLATVENICSENDIKYKLLGKSGYWRQPEVKAVLAYAKFAVSGSDASLKEVIRTPFTPTRYLKKADIIKHLTATKEMYGDTRLFDLLPQLQVEDTQREGRTTGYHHTSPLWPSGA